MNKRQRIGEPIGERIGEPIGYYGGGDDETHPPFTTWQDQSDFLTFRINQLCNTIEDIKAEHATQLAQLRMVIENIKAEHAN